MIFTCFLALASGNPKARVPYKCIKESEVCGFPSGLSFGPPSSFSTSDLKIILEKADDISFCKLMQKCCLYFVSFTYQNILP